MVRKNNRRGGNVITIHDVARHAGVSPMTVSRVINGESRVRDATRARVALSIETLHYMPNLAARSLASASSVHIGLLYTRSSAYLSEFLVGSLEQSSLSGCQLVLEKCGETEDPRKAIKRLAEAGVHGVILPPPLCDSEPALQALAEAGLPGTAVATGRPGMGLSAVSINDFEAARAMTRHLLSLGHKRIGFIIGHPAQTASGQRYRGFVEGLAEQGLTVDDRQVAQGYYTYRSGLEAAETLLGNGWKPSAIFASNDEMAAATMQTAHRKGLDVPSDLAIAGFDDTPIATMVWPELTTVRQPISEMAREAVRLLLGQIKRRRAGSAPHIEHKLLGYTLVERASSAPVTAKPKSRKS